MASNEDNNKKNPLTVPDILRILKENSAVVLGVLATLGGILGIKPIPIIYLRLGVAVFILLLTSYFLFNTPKEKPRPTYLLWITSKENRRPYEKVIAVALSIIAIIILFAFETPNVLYRYSFEKSDKENICWRVRKDQDEQPLGEAIKLSPVASRLGKQSLAFSLALPNQFYDAQHPTSGQQVDLETEAIRAEAVECTGTWDVPYEGRIQAWVCLPDAPEADNSVVTAEFFLQMQEGGWNVSAPVQLEAGEWVLLRWDVDHDRLESWRNWTQSISEPTRPIAFRIEIKLDESSLQQSFAGTVYIDEVVILDDQSPYHLWMLDINKYTYSAHCP